MRSAKPLPPDGLEVCGGGRLEKGGGEHHSVPFIHDFYDIELCTRGGFEVEIAGVRHRLTEGQLYLIPPHTVYTKHFSAPAGAASYLCIRWPAMPELLRLCGIPEGGILFPHRLNAACIAAMEAVIELLPVREALHIDTQQGLCTVEMLRQTGCAGSSVPKTALRCTAGFLQFAAELLQCLSPQQEQQPTLQQQYVERAARFLEVNSHLHIRVEDAAAHIGIDRSYLFALFRRQTGISPQQYLLRCRMKTACALLLQPQLSVAEVAASVGYDPCAFSRAFKKAIGSTPEEYRRLHPEKTP